MYVPSQGESFSAILDIHWTVRKFQDASRCTVSLSTEIALSEEYGTSI